MSFYKWFLENKKMCDIRIMCRGCKFIDEINEDEYCPFNEIENALFKKAHRLYKKEKHLK